MIEDFNFDVAADGRLWGGDRPALVAALDTSLRFLQMEKASHIYEQLRGLTGGEISRERVARSLSRFRHLLRAIYGTSDLQAALEREFVLWRPVGQTPSGVHFTGYCQPEYAASTLPDTQFRYPIFRLPPDLSRWKRPHPTRIELEGADGLNWRAGLLRSLPLAFLRDRLEAYFVQVEGTARLRLRDGRLLPVGYAGHTDWLYTGIGAELVRDGRIGREDLTQQALVAYFRAHPADVDAYLPRNRRFVFLRPTSAAPPGGGLGTPLTPERSIATDKAIMPPGALAVVRVDLVNPLAVRTIGKATLTRFVLDQDEGAAIKGPDRVDIFMGSGAVAEARAGVINAMGSLAYLLLRNIN